MSWKNSHNQCSKMHGMLCAGHAAGSGCVGKLCNGPFLLGPPPSSSGQGIWPQKASQELAAGTIVHSTASAWVLHGLGPAIPWQRRGVELIPISFCQGKQRECVDLHHFFLLSGEPI